MMKQFYCWLCALLLVLMSSVWANEPVEKMPEPAATESAEAFQLVMGNREITTFRVGILAYSAKDRVDAAQLRVDRIINQAKNGKVSAKPVMQPGEGIAILVDEQMAFTIQPADINNLAGETMDAAVAHSIEQLSSVIAERKERRNPQMLMLAAAYTVVATLVFAGALWLLARARVVLLMAGRRYIARPIAHLAKKTTGVSFALLNRVLRWTINGIVSVLGLSLLYTWVSFVFAQFPFTRAWSENLNEAIFGFLASAGLGALHAIPGLLVVVFIVVCARYISKLIHFAFTRIERGELNFGMFDRDTASTTRRIMSFLVWLLAIAMIYPYLPGANTEAFKGLSVMVGLMVSLGASSVVGQFASGLILIYAKSLKQGEYVQIGGTEGTVAHIGLFATKIHTNLREEVSIPNSVLVGQNVINFSRLAAGGGVISQVVITIGYDVAWRQVEAMLLEAARGTSGVRRDPAPRVFQTALSDWYVEYHLRVALDEPRRRLEILNDLHGKVQDVFNTYGVQIMSPNYIADPAGEKLVPMDKWYPAPAKKN